jgi:hypothetical protein
VVTGFTVQQHQVDLVVVDQPHALGVVAGLDELDREIGRGPGADGHPHPFADLGIVAVEQDGVRTVGHRAPTS